MVLLQKVNEIAKNFCDRDESEEAGIYSVAAVGLGCWTVVSSL